MSVARKIIADVAKAARGLELHDLRRGPVPANTDFELSPLDFFVMRLEAAPAALFLFPMWAAASAYLKDPQKYLNKTIVHCGELPPPQPQPQRGNPLFAVHSTTEVALTREDRARLAAYIHHWDSTDALANELRLLELNGEGQSARALQIKLRLAELKNSTAVSGLSEQLHFRLHIRNSSGSSWSAKTLAAQKDDWDRKQPHPDAPLIDEWAHLRDAATATLLDRWEFLIGMLDHDHYRDRALTELLAWTQTPEFWKTSPVLEIMESKTRMTHFSARQKDQNDHFYRDMNRLIGKLHAMMKDSQSIPALQLYCALNTNGIVYRYAVDEFIEDRLESLRRTSDETGIALAVFLLTAYRVDENRSDSHSDLAIKGVWSLVRRQMQAESPDSRLPAWIALVLKPNVLNRRGNELHETFAACRRCFSQGTPEQRITALAVYRQMADAIPLSEPTLQTDLETIIRFIHSESAELRRAAINTLDQLMPRIKRDPETQRRVRTALATTYGRSDSDRYELDLLRAQLDGDRDSDIVATWGVPETTPPPDDGEDGDDDEDGNGAARWDAAAVARRATPPNHAGGPAHLPGSAIAQFPPWLATLRKTVLESGTQVTLAAKAAAAEAVAARILEAVLHSATLQNTNHAADYRDPLAGFANSDHTPIGPNISASKAAIATAHAAKMSDGVKPVAQTHVLGPHLKYYRNGSTEGFEIRIVMDGELLMAFIPLEVAQTAMKTPQGVTYESGKIKIHLSPQSIDAPFNIPTRLLFSFRGTRGIYGNIQWPSAWTSASPGDWKPMRDAPYRGMAPAGWDLRTFLSRRDLYQAGQYLLRMSLPRRERPQGDRALPVIPEGPLQETYMDMIAILADILMSPKTDAQTATSMVRLLILEGENAGRLLAYRLKAMMTRLGSHGGVHHPDFQQGVNEAVQWVEDQFPIVRDRRLWIWDPNAGRSK